MGLCQEVWNQTDTLHVAQEFLRRMGSGAESAEIAKLFSENLEWEIAGDTGVLPWIGQKSQPPPGFQLALSETAGIRPLHAFDSPTW